MKKILITGAAGFIGSGLCDKLSSDHKIIGVDIANKPDNNTEITLIQIDLTDMNSVESICDKYFPDIIIHCAGIAHQKVGAVDFDTYLRVNSEATENLAKAAARRNPDVRFIYLSSVSVYGENNLNVPISEDAKCEPSSDYALSKLDAERRLIALSDDDLIHSLVILRLAPVYDHNWSLNLKRRVLAPMALAYLRFGSGSQTMSALALPNLIAFIEFMVERLSQIPNDLIQHNNLSDHRVAIFNVCDEKAYEFNKIIQVFNKSATCPNRPVISIPLGLVWLTTRLFGILFTKKKKWFHSGYEKLASNMIFDNTKMMQTGFKAVHSLEKIFIPY
jgi:nucleoside-diphosphate-sugar epimerase